MSAGICCVVGGPVSEKSRGSRLVEIAGPPTGSPSSSASSSFSLIHRGQQLLPTGWMQISASDSLSCLLGLLEGSLPLFFLSFALATVRFVLLSVEVTGFIAGGHAPPPTTGMFIL